jgi:hypothetical protein
MVTILSGSSIPSRWFLRHACRACDYSHVCTQLTGTYTGVSLKLRFMNGDNRSKSKEQNKSIEIMDSLAYAKTDQKQADRRRV